MLTLLAQLESAPDAPPVTGPWVYTVAAVSVLSIIIFAWKAWRDRKHNSDPIDSPELRYLAALRSEGGKVTTPSGTLIIGPMDDDDVIEEDRHLLARSRPAAPVEGDEPELEDDSWDELSADKRAGMLDALGAKMAARRKDVGMDVTTPSEVTLHCPQCGGDIALRASANERLVCAKCGAVIALRVVHPAPVPPRSLPAGGGGDGGSEPRQ